MGIHGNSDGSAARGKRGRKCIHLIKSYESNERKVGMAKAARIPESTL